MGAAFSAQHRRIIQLFKLRRTTHSEKSQTQPTRTKTPLSSPPPRSCYVAQCVYMRASYVNKASFSVLFLSFSEEGEGDVLALYTYSTVGWYFFLGVFNGRGGGEEAGQWQPYIPSKREELNSTLVCFHTSEEFIYCEFMYLYYCAYNLKYDTTK